MSIACIPSMDMVRQPVLHVEARAKTNGDGIIVRTDLIRDDVTEWLFKNFAVLSLRQEIRSFDGLKEPHAQALDTIVVTDCSGGAIDSGDYRLQDVVLDVQAYQLRQPDEGLHPLQHTEESADNGSDVPKANVTSLPNGELDGLWESLHFDQPIQSSLLRAISRMVSFSARKFNKWTINWNRLILLWGPPGTGKTSFCRGLAQKLVIRLGKHYPQSKLVEINAQSLGSKFFGESGKLVGKMFDGIEMLLEDGNEPFDAIRAVNALLTGLDKLRQHSNVVVVCTSNLVTALDTAFLDRVDIKQFIPHLSHRTIYELYKECLEELSRCGIMDGASFDVIQVDPDDPQTPLDFDEMLLNYQMFAHAVPTQLADLAAASEGISGRTVRRLPALSIVLHSHSRGCSIREGLEALRAGIEDEKKMKE